MTEGTRASAKHRRKEVAKNIAVFVLAVAGSAAVGAVVFGLLFGPLGLYGGAFLGFAVGLLGAVRVALNKGKAPKDVAHGGYIGPMGGGGEGL